MAVAEFLLLPYSRAATHGCDFHVQGINPTHIEFYSAAGASRVGAGYTFDGVSTADCNGHGSHISGTAAGLNVGVAKNATVHPGQLSALPCPRSACALRPELLALSASAVRAEWASTGLALLHRLPAGLLENGHKTCGVVFCIMNSDMCIISGPIAMATFVARVSTAQRKHQAHAGHWAAS